MSSRNSSRVAGTQMAGSFSRHPGSSASSGPGSITAPDSAWPPMLDAFSSTHTVARGVELLQADGRGEAGGTGADDHHVVFHDITFDHRASVGTVASVMIAVPAQCCRAIPVPLRARNRTLQPSYVTDTGRRGGRRRGSASRLRCARDAATGIARRQRAPRAADRDGQHREAGTAPQPGTRRCGNAAARARAGTCLRERTPARHPARARFSSLRVSRAPLPSRPRST